LLVLKNMTNDEKSFEENLKELEEIVRTLEEGESSLKETLERFEKGIHLSNLCAKELETAKQKIEKIVEND